MKIPTNEQLNDPVWWNDNAPEWAEHYCAEWNGFLNNTPPASCCVPRPAKLPAWNGEGCPPVGCDLECDTGFQNWCPAKCIALGRDHGDTVAIIQTTNRVFIVSGPGRMRPFRTKEQRVRDELIRILNESSMAKVGDMADAVLEEFELVRKVGDQ